LNRPTTKPPPYSEFEHIGETDKKFALYLANCDTVDTTIRRPRKTEVADLESPVKIEKIVEEGEKACQKLGCKEIIRKINAAGKKNRDERDDLAHEQRRIDDDLNELEDNANSLEEEANRIDSQAQNFQMIKSDLDAKLISAVSKNKSLEKEMAQLNTKIMLAEQEKRNIKNSLKDLVKTLSNLMWKGKRLSTAEESATRSYIPSLRIIQPNQAKRNNADKIVNTSYYGDL